MRRVVPYLCKICWHDAPVLQLPPITERVREAAGFAGDAALQGLEWGDLVSLLAGLPLQRILSAFGTENGAINKRAVLSAVRPSPPVGIASEGASRGRCCGLRLMLSPLAC